MQFMAECNSWPKLYRGSVARNPKKRDSSESLIRFRGIEFFDLYSGESNGRHFLKCLIDISHVMLWKTNFTVDDRPSHSCFKLFLLLESNIKPTVLFSTQQQQQEAEEEEVS